MGSPALMRLGTTVAGTGRLGVDPLGTSPLGGTDWPAYTLPPAAVGSDRLDAAEHIVHAEIVHERDGMVIGVLKRATRRKWRQVWPVISRDDAIALLAFAEQRRFYLLPTGEYQGGKIVVYWIGAETAAQSLRAGYRSLEAEWIEITGPAAAVV